MMKNTIMSCQRYSFIRKQIYKITIKKVVKKSELLITKLKKNGKLSKDDKKIGIIISEKGSNENKIYVVVKGYDKDGSLKPTKKYLLTKNKVVEEDKVIPEKVAVMDLYEKSIYLYGYEKDENYMTGYIVKEYNGNKSGINLIFTKEKVKVLLKNTNTSFEYSSVDSFIEKYYI